MKVLIVDDSKLLRDRLKISLQEIDNLEIIGEATNGVEAMQFIQKKTPDFIILDIGMPKMNGLEVLKKMKEAGSESSVCIFTNYSSDQYKQKCLDLGADFFFDKNHDFYALIDLALQLSSKNDQGFSQQNLAKIRSRMLAQSKLSQNNKLESQKYDHGKGIYK